MWRDFLPLLLGLAQGLEGVLVKSGLMQKMLNVNGEESHLKRRGSELLPL